MKEGKNRVSRVTTRTGDKGETGLADGSRLPKHAPRIELIGSLDELNSHIGYLVSLMPESRHRALLESIQQQLFNIGAEAAQPGAVHVKEEDVNDLDAHCDILQAELPPLREFVLPGGTQAGAWCHICRTTARRTERCQSAVNAESKGNPHSFAYLNRLSDLFFNLSRHINRSADEDEPQWKGV